jgi:hypothetical protein
MGSLYYGNDTRAIDIPDRVLAHLKVIIATKLRRGESFTISWKHQDDVAGGRTTLWMHASIPVRFTFDSAEVDSLDTALLQRLANEAGRSGGLTVDLDMFDRQPDRKPERHPERQPERQRELELVGGA